MRIWGSCRAARCSSEQENGDSNKTRLLRAAGSSAEGAGEGNSRGVSQARAEISPRPESRRQIRGREIQANPGSLRRAFGRQETADVRPVWLQYSGDGRRSGAGSGLRRRGSPGRPFRFRRIRFRRRRRGRRRGRGQFPRSLQPVFSRGECRASRAGTRAGQRSGISDRHHVCGSHARDGEETELHAAGCLQRVPRPGFAGRRKGLPSVRRVGTRDAGEREDALSSGLLALRRQRAPAHDVPQLRRRRAAFRAWRRSTCAFRRGRKRARACALPAGATPERTARRRAICTS